LDRKRLRRDVGEVARRQGEQMLQRALDLSELRLREDVQAALTVIDRRAFPARARAAWRSDGRSHMRTPIERELTTVPTPLFRAPLFRPCAEYCRSCRRSQMRSSLLPGSVSVSPRRYI